MNYRQVQPVSYSYNRANNNIYSNPEYLRLMMTQMSTPNFNSLFGNNEDNNADPFGGSNNAYGNVSNNFFNDLIKANSPTSVTPQMELSIYGGLIGKTITAVSNNQTIKGKVESVYLQNNKVTLNINGAKFMPDNITISKIE